MQKILLASHGSPGARAAEQAALSRLTAGDKLYHLVVVPEFWEGMQGDDWLNNAATRDVFADYVESTLEKEVKVEFGRVESAAKKLNVAYESRMIYGNPVRCLLDAVSDITPDIVVIGAPRPKSKSGLRSRMLTDDLMREISVPLLVIPCPEESR